MRRQAKLLTVLIAAALSAGCASGGGGEDFFETQPLTPPSETAEVRCFPFLPFICAWFEPGETSSDDGFLAFSVAEKSAARFTSWSALAPLEKAEFEALSSTVRYTESAPGEVGSVSAATPPQAEVVVRSHDPAATAAVAGMSLGATTVPGGSGAELRADPYAQGWNYQSFGIWDRHVSGSGTIGATSFGAVTPAPAVPSSGAATFTGRLGGLYISPTGQGSVASAQVSVNADFSSRSLSFASSGTTITRDHGIGTAAPQLNLGGTLTYSPSTNTFGGALTSAGGTMSGSSSGRYYGPAAQELGGVFTVMSATTVETLTGAYGAKR